MAKLLTLFSVAVLSFAAVVGRSEEPKTKAQGLHVLEAVPQGYHLQSYDDCGIAERQPHVVMKESYFFTFTTSDTDAELKARSAVFNINAVEMLYSDLDPKLSYVLAVTYANDHVYKRVQSLWANGEQLHEPFALPAAKAVRVVVRVPESVTKTGKMALEIRQHNGPNATASIVELWADGPATKDALKISDVVGLYPDLSGKILDMTYEPVVGAAVEVSLPGDDKPFAAVKSDADSSFHISQFSSNAPKSWTPKSGLKISAKMDDKSTTLNVPGSQLFEPVHYRPLPAQVEGLADFQESLDGIWKIHPTATEKLQSKPLDAAEWKDIKVPGQWKQQGFDLPRDRIVAMAKEFSIPKEWAGRRIFLRFNAIHAGTNYWLNGQSLGYSENLFTPVEWEITKQAKIGEKNRLDLEMKVDTISEMLSCSSNYAFHSLGGIDRSVSIFALPKTHVRNLHVATDLDKNYQDADLKLAFAIDASEKKKVEGLSLDVVLQDAQGKPVEHSMSNVKLASVETDASEVHEIVTHIKNPLKWSAEKPHLYKLALELKQNGKLLERIERNVGFRKIEVRGSQFFVNGVAVKLAGAGRHEVDPLTGRADTMRYGEQDVKLLKAANLNYIRTTHYPANIEMVEAADKYGMYLEVEAPLCWVGNFEDLKHLNEVLTPTSAMIDYYHSHPSVMFWSVANESAFNRLFEISNQLIKQLDPTRPTTFNYPDPKQICDLGNIHYPPMPYDEQDKHDPRPMVYGEYFFPVCHEQTDVRINPGLREFYGFGHSDPDSAFGRECAESFAKPFTKPCTPPGAWTHIVHSNRVMGAAMFAAFDDPFYFADGMHAGYAWHHGFWGLIDAWRRPKPEWWLAKMVFSPVWFQRRQVEYSPGQASVSIPVENRYSFTDLSELNWSWTIGPKSGEAKTSVPPGKEGNIEIPVPKDTPEGEKLVVKVSSAQGELINVASIQLGRKTVKPLPQPTAGVLQMQDDGKTVLIEGKDFSLVFDKTTGDFNAADPRHHSPITRFPSLHVTRYDFGDLAGPGAEPYAVFPNAKTRAVDDVTVQSKPEGVEITVREHFDFFAGTTTWLLDKNGVGKVRYDYTYSGKEMNTREAGIRFELTPSCDELAWRRWSEWDIFPTDSICRTEGKAKALRTGTRGTDPENVRPTWSWSQDQTELGTADFRSIKFNIYEASLRTNDGAGLTVHAKANAHVRSSLAENGVFFDVLSRCPLGQVVIKNGDRLSGEFVVEIAKP
jgi:beta-galactosidase/beta-glucuronidase